MYQVYGIVTLLLLVTTGIHYMEGSFSSSRASWMRTVRPHYSLSWCVSVDIFTLPVLVPSKAIHQVIRSPRVLSGACFEIIIHISCRCFDSLSPFSVVAGRKLET